MIFYIESGIKTYLKKYTILYNMSRLSNELKNNDNLEYIKEIQFSIFNPEHIRNGSVCEILSLMRYNYFSNIL